MSLFNDCLGLFRCYASYALDEFSQYFLQPSSAIPAYVGLTDGRLQSLLRVFCFYMI